jgi:hypothetical protein
MAPVGTGRPLGRDAPGVGTRTPTLGLDLVAPASLGLVDLSRPRTDDAFGVQQTPHSSRGLGHRPLKAEITGSNPVCGTNEATDAPGPRPGGVSLSAQSPGGGTSLAGMWKRWWTISWTGRLPPLGRRAKNDADRREAPIPCRWNFDQTLRRLAAWGRAPEMRASAGSEERVSS